MLNLPTPEAKQFDFYSVCVNPYYVEYASKLLEGSDVLVCTVIGFPLGANTIEIKVLETIDAIKNGADEIDMVINIGWAKEGKWAELTAEIAAIKAACKGKLLKVIIETCLLTDEEKIAHYERVRYLIGKFKEATGEDLDQTIKDTKNQTNQHNEDRHQ